MDWKAYFSSMLLCTCMCVSFCFQGILKFFFSFLGCMQYKPLYRFFFYSVIYSHDLRLGNEEEEKKMEIIFYSNMQI